MKGKLFLFLITIMLVGCAHLNEKPKIDLGLIHFKIMTWPIETLVRGVYSIPRSRDGFDIMEKKPEKKSSIF
jgi:hypothetical protein